MFAAKALRRLPSGENCIQCKKNGEKLSYSASLPFSAISPENQKSKIKSRKPKAVESRKLQALTEFEASVEETVESKMRVICLRLDLETPPHIVLARN